MSALPFIAEQFILDKLLNAPAPLSPRGSSGNIIVSAAGLFLLLGTCVLIYGAYLWLGMHYTPDIAMLITGLLIMTLSLLCAIAAYMLHRYKRSKIKAIKRELVETMHTALEIADEELSEPIRNNPKTSVAIATLAGFIAGEKLF